MLSAAGIQQHLLWKQQVNHEIASCFYSKLSWIFLVHLNFEAIVNVVVIMIRYSFLRNSMKS